jgi:hypothetical protein
VAKAGSVVYVVVYSLPGCLPDDPDSNSCFSSMEKAKRYIAEERREGRGTSNDPYVFDIIEMSREEALKEGYEIL